MNDTPVRNHVMIDLETLGTTPGSVVLSIGAVMFNPAEMPMRTASLGAGFHRNIGIQSCLNAGLGVDGRTIEWWLGQTTLPIAALFTPKPVPLREALAGFRRWLDRLREFLNTSPFISSYAEDRQVYVWGHGSTFDVSLLAAAYGALKQPVPWSWRNVRDTRTLFDAAKLGSLSEALRIGTHHNPLDDAKTQANGVQAAYQLLGKTQYAPPRVEVPEAMSGAGIPRHPNTGGGALVRLDEPKGGH